jgi:hypothetical protein
VTPEDRIPELQPADSAPEPKPVKRTPPPRLPERTPEQITQEIKLERAGLASAAADLRVSIDETRARVNAVKRKLPFIVAGTTAAAFVVSSGLGATFRLFAGRQRHPDTERWRLGRWSIHEDDD